MEALQRILCTPQILFWLLIIIMFLIGRFGFSIHYLSVKDIVLNHLRCFKKVNGKWMVIPIINYMIIPFAMGLATVFVKEIDDDIINIIIIIISIFTAMLFTMLTMIIDMKSKIKDNPYYYSNEAEISKKSLVESYYTVMFEILISVILLILCLFNCFTKTFGYVQSFLIYSFMYLLIFNLLMIIRRIYRVIDTDMNK